MHSIRDLIQLSTDFLKRKNVASARFCAEELLAFILKKKRLDLLIDYDAPVEKPEVDFFRDLIRRKADGEPLGYLLKSVEFLDCIIDLEPGIFIPRQETEIFVSLALKEISDENKILWDLCTGSGCMGLAAKKYRPHLQVVLSDISEEALICAKSNASKNNLEVNTLQGDLLFPFRGKTADIIFCNPPYVSEEEYPKLEKEVHFEPKRAHVAKESGLEFYYRLSVELPLYLSPGAKIFLEIGDRQGEEVMEIFNQNHWRQKRYERDWSGKDRFFFLEFRPELL